VYGAGYSGATVNLFLIEAEMTPEEMQQKAIDLFKKRFH
jgi:hypothetical protein